MGTRRTKKGGFVFNRKDGERFEGPFAEAVALGVDERDTERHRGDGMFDGGPMRRGTGRAKGSRRGMPELKEVNSPCSPAEIKEGRISARNLDGRKAFFTSKSGEKVSVLCNPVAKVLPDGKGGFEVVQRSTDVEPVPASVAVAAEARRSRLAQVRSGNELLWVKESYVVNGTWDAPDEKLLGQVRGQEIVVGGAKHYAVTYRKRYDDGTVATESRFREIRKRVGEAVLVRVRGGETPRPEETEIYAWVESKRLHA